MKKLIRFTSHLPGRVPFSPAIVVLASVCLLTGFERALWHATPVAAGNTGNCMTTSCSMAVSVKAAPPVSPLHALQSGLPVFISDAAPVSEASENGAYASEEDSRQGPLSMINSCVSGLRNLLP